MVVAGMGVLDRTEMQLHDTLICYMIQQDEWR